MQLQPLLLDAQSESKDDSPAFSRSEQKVRQAWVVGDEVEIFSDTVQEWFMAKVIRIFTDDEGEWLECLYKRSKRDTGKKQVQRFSTAVRPECNLPECTLVIFKPDSFMQCHGLIETRILSNGFSAEHVIDMKQTYLTPTRAEAFYAQHKERSFFRQLISFMTSGPICALRLQKPGAIKRWLKIMGSTKTDMDSWDPTSIRSRIGTSMIQNAVHGSRSMDAATRELDFFFNCEQTLALIKPDAVAAGKADEIVALIESEGFTVVEMARMTLSRERAEELYAEHKGEDYFDELIGFMTCGELIALKLEKNDAIKELRGLMGPADFELAQEYPRSIRALYGSSTTKNAVHGSDSLLSAVRELSIIFPQQVTLAMIKPHAATHYKDIKRRIIAEGFTILEVRSHDLNEEMVKALYAEHKDRDYFPELVTSMTTKGRWGWSSMGVFFKLRATNAIAKLRALTGPANAEEAKKHAPNSIRGLYATSTIKNALHCADSAESVKRELEICFPCASNEPRRTKQYTLALIKPDVVASGEAQMIVNRVMYEGFVIIDQLQLKLSKERAAEFYSEHKGRDFFDELIAFMTSGEVIALKLEREGAVQKWRAVIGPTNLAVAKKECPQSLRALYATNAIRNATHGSDSARSAKRELDFFFA